MAGTSQSPDEGATPGGDDSAPPGPGRTDPGAAGTAAEPATESAKRPGKAGGAGAGGDALDGRVRRTRAGRTAEQPGGTGAALNGRAARGGVPGRRRQGGGRGGDGESRRGRPRPLLGVALVLAVAAAVAAALGGWSWYGAAHDDDAAFARARDTVLAAGEQAVQNLNTLAYTDLDHGLDIWESSTTGDLHTQLTQGRDDFARQVRQARTTSTAKVLSGAVTELDTRTGRAGVMIALRITVQAPDSKPAVKESRMLGELTRTAGGWKLSALGQAPMGDSAPDPATTGSATTAPATPAAPTTPQPTASR